MDGKYRVYIIYIAIGLVYTWDQVQHKHKHVKHQLTSHDMVKY